MTPAELRVLVAKATPGPWCVSSDDATDTTDHANSGLARVDSAAPPVRVFKSGRPVPHWPAARLCEWPDAHLIAAAVNALPELLDRLEAAERDAERYRWLRDESHREPSAPGPIYRSLYDTCGDKRALLQFVWLRFGPELDAAIDAARGKP